jgi:GR25 family glycosyltransferase involved in LPS biosynthesis
MARRKSSLLWGILLGALLFSVAAVTCWMYCKPGGHESFAAGVYQEPTQILLINLDSRKDRYDHFMKSAKDNAIPYPIVRLSATKGADLDWKEVVAPETHAEFSKYLETGKRASHRSLSTGALGCYMSHLEALRRVVAAGKPMLICEDDMVFRPETVSEIRTALGGAVPFDPNTLILFHILCDPKEHVCTPLSVGSKVLDPESFWSTACYYVTPTAAQHILENSMPMTVQIDAQLADIKRDGKLHIYAYPCVDTDIKLGTDIQAPLA